MAQLTAENIVVKGSVYLLRLIYVQFQLSPEANIFIDILDFLTIKDLLYS